MNVDLIHSHSEQCWTQFPAMPTPDKHKTPLFLSLFKAPHPLLQQRGIWSKSFKLWKPYPQLKMSELLIQETGSEG